VTMAETIPGQFFTDIYTGSCTHPPSLTHAAGKRAQRRTALA
jgi:hypothetical protein